MAMWESNGTFSCRHTNDVFGLRNHDNQCRIDLVERPAEVQMPFYLTEVATKPGRRWPGYVSESVTIA